MDSLVATPGYSKPASSTTIREISSVPYKILDAPGLQDDFYLNVLDWIADNSVVVSLAQSVYRWCPTSGKASKLYSVPFEDTLSSL